jgi:subtilisin family serine protease
MGGYDFADNDSDPRNDCAQQGHGTAVAGIAVGNGGGVVGTAPDARIVMLKIQSAQQCGGDLLDGDFIAALDWVLTHREQYSIDIISMSLGGQAFSSALVCDNAILAMRQLIDLAHDVGLIIFAAAGNDAQPSAIAQPACMSNVISVGAVYDANLGPTHFSICSDATTNPDRVTCYSNRADFLDLLAPAHCATTASTISGQEVCFGGTSASTPFAAGIAATLLEAANIPLTNDHMRNLLTTSGVIVLDETNGLFIPRIDAQAALDALATLPPPPSDMPCTDCTLYTGTLSDNDDRDIQPDGTYYFSSAGTHQGWLTAPEQTHFNLDLLKWTGTLWATVAESSEAGSEAFISYQGTAGYYAWRIMSYKGGGSYNFWLQRP